MKLAKSVMKPGKTQRTLSPPIKFPPSETVQGDSLGIKELFEKFNASPEMMSNNYFDASEHEVLHRFLRPDIDLTDLQELQKFNADLNEKLEAASKRKVEKEPEPEPESEPEEDD